MNKTFCHLRDVLNEKLNIYTVQTDVAVCRLSIIRKGKTGMNRIEWSNSNNTCLEMGKGLIKFNKTAQVEEFYEIVGYLVTE